MKKLLKQEDIEQYITTGKVKNGTKNIWLVTFQQWLEFRGIKKEFQNPLFFVKQKIFSFVKQMCSLF